jgi:cysteine-rich repeat protein
MMKILVLPLVLCGVIAAAPQRATAASDPLLKCASSKLKAASKKEAGKFNCLSKDAAKPDPVKLSACIAKVESAFGPAFTKADSKGACTGRAQDLEATADLCIQNVAALIPPGTDTCDVPSGFCVTAATRPCKADADCSLPKCTSAKLKAVGKGAGGELNCYSKATGKAVAVDPTCLSKASTGLATSFTKADAKGACGGDPAAVNNEITNGCVTPVNGQLPAKAPGCGNGITEGFPPFNETCDDGNTQNGDGCPASCHVDTCTVTATSFGAHVTFTNNAGTTISGLGYFVDYPEGKVGGLATSAPPGVSANVNDLGYGFTANAVKIGGLPSPMLTLTFKTCQGAPAATAADFSCTVTDASDDDGNVVDPSLVTCAVSVP